MDINAELGEAKNCVQSFGSGCLDEVNKYRIGVQQLVTGKPYEQKQSSKHGAELAAEKAGGFVVDAAAFIGACTLAPHRKEAEIAEALRAASPTASPNLLIVEHADRLLGREGRMVEAVRAIGRGAECMEGVPFAVELD